MRGLWSEMPPLYFIATVVMVLGLVVYVLFNPDRTLIPVLFTAFGLIIAALGQVIKGNEDDTKDPCSACPSGNFTDLLEQIVHEAREIRGILEEISHKESDGKEVAHAATKAKRLVLVAACISVLGVLLYRRR